VCERVRNGAGDTRVSPRGWSRTEPNDERRSASARPGSECGNGEQSFHSNVASPSQRETLANLVQFYIHDFSEFLSAERKLAVEEDGRFSDLLRLDKYWNDLIALCGSSALVVSSRDLRCSTRGRIANGLLDGFNWASSS